MRLFGQDRICAVVAAPNAQEMLRYLRHALRHTRTIELRLDWLDNELEIIRFLRRLEAYRSRAVLIATLRRRAAGGRYWGSIPAQVIFLGLANRSGCAWCDLELESFARSPRNLLEKVLGPGRRLLSLHQFVGAPRRVVPLARKMLRARCDGIKVAIQCRSIAESLEVLKVARSLPGSVAVPMGELALPARVLALREGSALAYASAGERTAPGQLSIEEMKYLYRADRLDRRTKVYGVIGNPVAHSLSPVLHNTGFHERKLNAVYLPFLVRELPDFLGAIRPLGIAGFSVTLPHKEAILMHLEDCDPLAERIRAVNTVVVRNGRGLYGYNTDYVGVLRALERRVRLAGSRVLLYGAGGSARAAAFALSQGGAVVAVCARRPRAAASLARAVGGEALPRAALRREFFDAIVNTTPVGLHPRVSESPLRPAELNCRVVMDLIYRPPKTRLLQLAEGRGIETISGLEMFIAQGTAQWEIWTGLRAPVAAMRRAVIRALRAEARACRSTGDHS